jgi:hypothetical protein
MISLIQISLRKYCVHFPSPPYVSKEPTISFSPWFDHQNIWWGVKTMKRLVMQIPPARAAEYVSGTSKKFFSGPAARTNKQRATYARWPLAASAVHPTIRYIITSDTKEKDKNMQHIRAPGHPPDRRALTSVPSRRHYLQPPITFSFWCEGMVTYT